MRATSFAAVAVSALAFSAIGLNAQSVISARSGVLHYYEGDVTVDGQVPHQKPGTFANVKENQELATQTGRAEVLLTPGVFLRLGENSAIRMISTHLTDTQVQFEKGSAILDFVEVAKDNKVTVNYQDYKVSFGKRGIYRFDSEPAELQVYTGEATITHGTNTVNLKDGREAVFTPALVSEKFDNKTGDALYRWAKRRSEYISVANLSAARQASSSGYAPGGVGGWYFNPYYSMYTYIPTRGYLCDPFSTFMDPFFNPFGCYYSPMGAWNYFRQPYYYGGGGGGYYGGTSRRGAYSAVTHYPTSIGTARATAARAGSGSGPAAFAGRSGGFGGGGYSAASSSPGVYSGGGGGVSSSGGGGGGFSRGGGGFSSVGGGGGGGGGGARGGGGGGGGGGRGR